MGQNKNNTQILHMLFWPVLLAIALLGIALSLRWFLALELDEAFWRLLSYGWLATAVLSQALVTLIVTVAWKKNLDLHGVLVTLRQAVTMIGINSIGKYSPGKVVGVVARGAALYRMHADGRVAVQTALVEQIAMLHSGAAVALTAWLLDSGRPIAAAIALSGTIASVHIVSRSGETVVILFSRLFRRQTVAAGAGQGFQRSYSIVFTAMMLVWVLSTLTLYCCILTMHSGDATNFWWLIWILALAYLGGFAAFLLPAGLGARDGVLLAFLSSQIDTSVAAYVVILHRLITLLIDLLLGAGALLSGKDLVAPR